LESAAIPGVERVTSELSDDEELSNGSLSNKALSMSEWKVGSFSSKSAAWASTVTEVVEPETWRLMLTLTGTTDRTSTSRELGANPVTVTAK
jgi:hypothetical protein